MRQEKKYLVRSFLPGGLFVLWVVGSQGLAHDVPCVDIDTAKVPSVGIKKRSGPRVHALAFLGALTLEQALQQSQSQKTASVVSESSPVNHGCQQDIPLSPKGVAHASVASRLSSIIRSFFGSAIAVGKFLHTVFLKK